MGCLLKKKDSIGIFMFYSKPEYGYYIDKRNSISLSEYDDWVKVGLADDMVWIAETWYDVTNANTKQAHGIVVSEFVADCVLQGNKLTEEVPYEF